MVDLNMSDSVDKHSMMLWFEEVDMMLILNMINQAVQFKPSFKVDTATNYIPAEQSR